MSKEKLSLDEKAHAFQEYCLREFHRSRGEEWANALTHFAGAIFGIVALILMMVFASLHGTAWHIVACAIYGATLIILFNSSGFYHVFKNFRVKRVFQIFDHCSIYLLIAGTYTPFCFITLKHNVWGWTIFGIVWGLTLVGILIEVCKNEWVNYVSLPIYLLMGWTILLDISTVFANLSKTGLVLLVTGGVVYTLGVIFYVMDKVPWMHTIWHIFVLGGAVTQWVCVCFCLIPTA